MTKNFLAPATMCLILAGTTAAAAQAAPAPMDASATPLRAGGAAGYPATPGIFERVWADLGFTKKTDETQTAVTSARTQTADAR
ncbi:MAG: hypothetical protein ABSD74_12390 [Rhizomicrobium sp.]|jgi:hypothetical protein